ncbi:MAG: hydrogenase maturation peptidase HycI [Endomicrobiaceae bacterium]|nr:hydrogenase maturation peptidase HycI [Endomicrobiaceae bacterium]
MEQLKTIESFLSNAEKTLFLAIGSELRTDDAVGMYIADELLKYNLNKDKICIIKGATAPENFTGEIKKFRPAKMLIIDAADTGKKTGEIDIIDASSVQGASFSTHMMPINIFIDYLLQYFDCKILIVGIQPENLEFGLNITSKIKKSADKLVKLIAKKIIS